MKDNTRRLAEFMSARKLHGHTKITLRDLSGGVKVIEKDNLVTNAVPDIFKCDYAGFMNISKLLPLRQLFGGIYLFENPVTENANSYYPQSQLANRMIGHAGQTAHSSASPYRGNPNGALSQEITGGYRFVYDFATNQGNGTLSAVCMVPSNAGDVGLIPYDTTTPLIVRDIAYEVDNVNRIAPQGVVDATNAQHNPFKFNGDGSEGVALWVNGNTLTEYTVEHNYTKFELNLGAADYEATNTRTCTLSRSFTNNRVTFAEDENYYYIIENPNDGGHALLVDKVDKTTFTATGSTLSIDNSLFLKALDINVGKIWPRFPYGKEGANIYIYWPNTTNSFIRINLNNGADATALTSNLDNWQNNPLNRGFVQINERLYTGDGYLINGDNVYKVANIPQLVTESTPGSIPLHFARNLETGKPCPRAIPWGASYLESGSSSWRGLSGPSIMYPFLSTINNLGSSVSKSASQTMEIQYDIVVV